MGFIYKITCSVNNKIYIGQTRGSLKERFCNHISAALRKNFLKTALCFSIRKYGREAFSITLLEECGDELLNERERFYIKELNSYSRNGYNMSPGGDGGQNLTPEIRARIAKTLKGRIRQPHTKETILKISRSNTGKTRTLEQRMRIKLSRTYGPLSEAHKLKISQGLNANKKFILSLVDYQKIKTLVLKEKSDAKIAQQFNVSRKMIWRIRNDKYNRYFNSNTSETLLG